jgi:hypothetical protein
VTRRLLLLACPVALGCGSAVSSEMADAGRDTGFGPPPPYVDTGVPGDASWKRTDGGYVAPDGGVIPADRFITHVVSYSIGPCGGYGRSMMPGVVEGPPMGGGAYAGSTDVLSLGNGGEIIVSFEPNEIVDGPGVDFIVFENPFYLAGTTRVADAEPAQVSVSDDLVTWTSFPCNDTTSSPIDGSFEECAGVHPVLSNPDNDISPLDPKTAGGDPYDLATIGKKSAKYVRIVDKIIEPCTPGSEQNEDGFDLDAIAVIHGKLP